MSNSRILLDGATYHVTLTVDQDDMSPLEPQFKTLFLSFIERAKRIFHFRLWDFCIIGNHIHFLIKPSKDGTLSKIMQWIQCNFAKAWNKEQGQTGHVWRERFYSHIIARIPDFLWVRESPAEKPVMSDVFDNVAL
jgi:REP element-mobilizing transposase RayT